MGPPPNPKVNILLQKMCFILVFRSEHIDYLKLLYVTYKKECMKTVSLYLSIFKSVTIPLGGIEISKSGYWGKLNFASQSPSSNFSPFSQ